MTLFFVKSLIALLMSGLSLIAMVTMFEVFGRSEKRYDTDRMKKIHRTTGRIYFLLFAVTMYFCLSFIVMTKAELSVRAAFHGTFALIILVLFALKLSYVRLYRRYYERAKIIGLLMALMTFGLVGTSAAYYLLVSEFGTDASFDTLMRYKQLAFAQRPGKEAQMPNGIVTTDPESAERGKALFDAKCKFCHTANSTETVVGPGLKGVLKRNDLPFSGRPATPGNVIRQLKEPFNRMPSFEYLTDEELSDIVAYLNTL